MPPGTRDPPMHGNGLSGGRKLRVVDSALALVEPNKNAASRFVSADYMTQASAARRRCSRGASPHDQAR
jgi:hypothetical protein